MGMGMGVGVGLHLAHLSCHETHPLMEPLAIRLSRQKTAAKSLVNPSPPGATATIAKFA